MQPRHALLVAVLVVSAGCSGALGIQTDTPTDEPATTPGGTSTDVPTPVPTDTPAVGGSTPTPGSDGPDGTPTARVAPPDPPSDRLGWEGGLWYNETIDVDQSNGLNDTELSLVVNRSMARVERVRELEFEEPVPVEVISREEFRNRTVGRYENLSDAARLHHNTKLEALFFVGEDEDAIATQRSLVTGGTGGFYVPSEDRIVVISENTTSPKLDEITLSQELFHALQDQVLPSPYDMNFSNEGLTTELHNTNDGVVEGDGNYVDYLYERRCAAAWDCLPPTDGPAGSGDIHLGLFVTSFQPYSDGPPFVRSVHRRDGWTGVNELYRDPPASTEQVIHPEKYGEDPPTDVTVTDRSADEWRIIERSNDSVGIGFVQTSARNETFGEAGLFSMFMYPAFESNGRTQLVAAARFFNRNGSGGLDPVDPYDYNASLSAGWDGDTLVMYANPASDETGETGYVWKTVWDSRADAREFREGYARLLAFHDAEQVGPDTYRLPESSGFGDAIHVTVDGRVVTIVNAPTVDRLEEIDSSVTVEATGDGSRD